MARPIDAEIRREMRAVLRSEGLVQALNYIDQLACIQNYLRHIYRSDLLSRSRRLIDALIEIENAISSNRDIKDEFWENRDLLYHINCVDCLLEMDQFSEALGKLRVTRTLAQAVAGDLRDDLLLREAFIYFSQNEFDQSLLILNEIDSGYIITSQLHLSYSDLKHTVLERIHNRKQE